MLDEHLGYIADRVRLRQFRAAITAALDRGDRVADLGSGSGILGVLCCRAGAGRVFAIDSTAMIDVARETFRRAGLAEQAVFIRGQSQRIALPETVDLVICDHVGYFGIDYGIVDMLRDARDRFLKPDGLLIPRLIRLQLAAVQSAGAWHQASAWAGEDAPSEFRWLRQFTINRKHGLRLAADAVLGGPAELGRIDLYWDQPDFFSWEVELQIERDGVMHGFAGWFDCELSEGVWMTNSPLSQGAIDRPQAFLPIDEAIPVRTGDVVKAVIMARPSDHLISWVAEFPAAGRRFRHSTWKGMVLGSDNLFLARDDRVPRPTPEGQARMTVLQYCDGLRSAREIEQLVLNEHPSMFPSAQAVSSFVKQVLSRDTE
jgi:protein arginine N-methyltransferase 1